MQTEISSGEKSILAFVSQAVVKANNYTDFKDALSVFNEKEYSSEFRQALDVFSTISINMPLDNKDEYFTGVIEKYRSSSVKIENIVADAVFYAIKSYNKQGEG
jgi:hypothetical protein